MSLRAKFIFKLLLLLLFVFTVNTSLALNNTPHNVFQPQNQLIDNYTGNTTDLEGTSNVEQEALLQFYNSFDRTVNMLNSVIAAMGVLVGLIGLVFTLFTLIIGLFTLLGFSGIKSVKKIKSSMEKLFIDTKEQSEKKLEEIDTQLIEVKSMCEDTDKQIKTFMKELNEYGKNEIDEMIKEIPNLLSDKNFSEEIIDRLDIEEKRLENMEVLGIPLETVDLLNRGVNLFIKEQYEDAISEFDKVLTQEPKNFKALSFKGLSLSNLGKFSESIEICNKVLEVKKYYYPALIAKGYSMGNLGKHEDAFKVYNTILRINSKDIHALTNMGYSLAKLGKFPQALKTLNEVLDINPKDSNMLYMRACVYSLMKDKEHAIQDLKQSIELNPSFKERARNEEDFKNFEDLWNDVSFKETIE